MSELRNLSIHTWQEGDLSFAAACTSGEGWVSEDFATLEGFSIKDPHGCFLAEIDGKHVGICVATSYGKSGFIGELIVRAEARGLGVGAALLDQGITYLQSRGAETIYLDGVLKAVGLYERNGFRKVCRSWRFSGHLAGQLESNVRRMTALDLEQVCDLDQKYFGEDRSFFLKRRLVLFPELGFVSTEAEQINGYILGRGGAGWLSAGPWVVDDHTHGPAGLLWAVALEARGRPVTLGILDTNRQAIGLVQSLGFEPRDDSPWRMALGPKNDLGASPNCYAVGSAAKG